MVNCVRPAKACEWAGPRGGGICATRRNRRTAVFQACHQLPPCRTALCDTAALGQAPCRRAARTVRAVQVHLGTTDAHFQIRGPSGPVRAARSRFFQIMTLISAAPGAAMAAAVVRTPPFFLKVEASAAGKLPLPFHTSYACISAPSGPGPERGRRLAALMVAPRRAGRGRARSCRPARARQRPARRRDAAAAARIGDRHPARIPVNFLPSMCIQVPVCKARKAGSGPAPHAVPAKRTGPHAAPFPPRHRVRRRPPPRGAPPRGRPSYPILTRARGARRGRGPGPGGGRRRLLP